MPARTLLVRLVLERHRQAAEPRLPRVPRAAAEGEPEQGRGDRDPVPAAHVRALRRRLPAIFDAADLKAYALVSPFDGGVVAHGQGSLAPGTASRAVSLDVKSHIFDVHGTCAYPDCAGHMRPFDGAYRHQCSPGPPTLVAQLLMRTLRNTARLNR